YRCRDVCAWVALGDVGEEVGVEGPGIVRGGIWALHEEPEVTFYAFATNQGPSLPLVSPVVGLPTVTRCGRRDHPRPALLPPKVVGQFELGRGSGDVERSRLGSRHHF